MRGQDLPAFLLGISAKKQRKRLSEFCPNLVAYILTSLPADAMIVFVKPFFAEWALLERDFRCPNKALLG